MTWLSRPVAVASIVRRTLPVIGLPCVSFKAAGMSIKTYRTDDRSIPMYWEVQAAVRFYGLDGTIQELTAERGLEDPACVRLTGIYHNLIRYWADA